jgi:3-hydroxymyristoyl/3-hydroxydecanoyl-(acyl carrier protein) dehydratase
VFHTRLLEIYGSTETGQIATRRTAESLTWNLWPNVRLVARDDQAFAQGGHVEQMTALGDVIEITGEAEFLLHGRKADMVNVAGKRSSFDYLNSQLNAIPGVVDGAFFLRDAHTSGGTGVVRLAAVVVAPTLSAAELTDHLRQRIDPVFLPRPLLLVDRLPRNATGKLPHEALQSLANQRLRTSNRTAPQGPADSSVELRIAEHHPAFAGHFPGKPLLPGAALLDEALHEIAIARQIDLTRWQLSSAKFLQPVLPGIVLNLEHSAPHEGSLRFVIRAAGTIVASGSLTAVTTTSDGNHGD